MSNCKNAIECMKKENIKWGRTSSSNAKVIWPKEDDDAYRINDKKSKKQWGR
jgi:hypothetical protein